MPPRSEEAVCLIVEFPPLLPLLDLVSMSQTSNVILMGGGWFNSNIFSF